MTYYLHLQFPLDANIDVTERIESVTRRDAENILFGDDTVSLELAFESWTKLRSAIAAVDTLEISDLTWDTSVGIDRNRSLSC